MMMVACVLDIAVGWPDRLYAKVGHPVTWVGRLITVLDKRLNSGSESKRFWTGAMSTAIVIAVFGGLAALAQAALPSDWAGVIIGGVLAWPLVAIRSMHTHATAVLQPLAVGDLERGQQAVSMIVGRDPTNLDLAGVARGALESLAENTSDGIVAPVFWGVIAGLPGIAVYKAINTLDSMIGHRNTTYEHFGKVAARLDDLANFIPARLTGLIFALVSSHPAKSLRVMWRDASHHRSPNAGWPESAMAGALSVRLSGPRIYRDGMAQEPWLNEGSPDPGYQDLARGLGLYRRTIVALVASVGLVFWAGV